MLLLNFLVGSNTRMKNLGYRSECSISVQPDITSSLSTVFIALLKEKRVPISCMLPTQLFRNGQSCTKIFEYKFKPFLIHYSSHKQISTTTCIHKDGKLNYSLLDIHCKPL